MALILDTNALSAAAEREPSALEVVARAKRLAIPVIVLGEYRLEIAQSWHRASYETWLREWIAPVSVLDIDDDTTHSYAATGLELKKKVSRFLPMICGLPRSAGNILFRS